MIPSPTEIWAFRSPTIPRGELAFKYHLCIDGVGIFLFVSTYRKHHDGSMPIPNSAVPFLPATESGRSQISCMTIIRRTFLDHTIPRNNPRGRMAKETVLELVRFVETSKTLTGYERETILESLYDYYGADLA